MNFTFLKPPVTFIYSKFGILKFNLKMLFKNAAEAEIERADLPDLAPGSSTACTDELPTDRALSVKEFFCAKSYHLL